MAYPRFQRSRSFKFKQRSAGNVLISSTSYVAVDTATDIALNCQIGDVLEVGATFIWGNEAGDGRVDACTMNGGTVVNYVSGNGSGGDGILGLYVPGTLAQYASKYAACFYTVQSGDIFNGLVSMRVFAKETSASRTILASSTDVFTFWAKNLGPVDPN